MIEAVSYALLENSPIGPLWVATSDQGVVSLSFGGDELEFVGRVKKLTMTEPVQDRQNLDTVFWQLSSYLDGELREFDLPICWFVMTEFQQKALRHVHAIPYGELRSYNDIAHAVGNPKSIRAVGRANATNPIPIIVPCHRVIGSNGKLTGFAGGLETKAKLLQMEGSWLL